MQDNTSTAEGSRNTHVRPAVDYTQVAATATSCRCAPWLLFSTATEWGQESVVLEAHVAGG